MTTPTATATGGRRTHVEVREVHSFRDRRRFVRLPWRIYKGDPQWVPPLMLERLEFIHPRKHPFYRHGAATQFLALVDGEPAGRILVSDDPLYNAEHEENLGCFGMFESIDDEAVAHALLDAAAQWLGSRGRVAIRGPIDYSMNYACGLLVDGFDTPPRVMMNHNPPYYADLLESWGLERAKNLIGWWFLPNQESCRSWQPRVERIARRSGIVVRPFREDDFEAEVERAKQVYNRAWYRNWGFVRMTDAEFRDFARHLVDLAVPELILLAEIEGQAVGFSLTLPDFNEAIRPLNGRLFRYGLPLGWWQFRRACRRIKTGRLLALGVVEGYRRRGVAEMLILRTMHYGHNQLGYEAAELGWTLEDNHLINRTIEAVGAYRYKTYRIYEKSLAT